MSNNDVDSSLSRDDTDENSGTSTSTAISPDTSTMNWFVEIVQLPEFNWFEFKERIEEVRENHEVVSEMFHEHIKTSSSDSPTLIESVLQAVLTLREA